MARKFPVQDYIESQSLMERYVSDDVGPIERRRIEARIFQMYQPMIYGTAAKIGKRNEELKEYLEEKAIMGFDYAMKKYKADGAKFSYYAARIVRDYCMGGLKKFYNMTTAVESHLLYNMPKIMAKIEAEHPELTPDQQDDKIVEMILKHRKKSGEPLETNPKIIRSSLASYREKMGFSVSMANPVQSSLPEGDLFDVIEDSFAPEGSSALIDKNERELLRSLFVEALSTLPARSVDIYLERSKTMPGSKVANDTHAVKLEDLAEKYEITRERVRQLEVTGGNQIRGAFLLTALNRGIDKIGNIDIAEELEKVPAKFLKTSKMSGEKYQVGPDWVCPE